MWLLSLPRHSGLVDAFVAELSMAVMADGIYHFEGNIHGKNRKDQLEIDIALNVKIVAAGCSVLRLHHVDLQHHSAAAMIQQASTLGGGSPLLLLSPKYAAVWCGWQHGVDTGYGKYVERCRQAGLRVVVLAYGT
jgi:hypothetical protein